MTRWNHTSPIRTARHGYAVEVSLRCFLGHGASGSAASMAPFVSGLRERGVEAVAIDLPKRKAEDAVPAFHLVVPSAADVVVGGHSFGGRVASLAAAEPGAPYAALVLFSYPLHPPGSTRTHRRPDQPLAVHHVPGPSPVRREPIRSPGSSFFGRRCGCSLTPSS